MEYMTMAQSVGEEPFRDSGDSPEDVQEYFGGDMDAATEYYAEQRKESLYAENQRLKARIAELEGCDYVSDPVDGWADYNGGFGE